MDVLINIILYYRTAYNCTPYCELETLITSYTLWEDLTNEFIDFYNKSFANGPMVLIRVNH